MVVEQRYSKRKMTPEKVLSLNPDGPSQSESEKREVPKGLS